MALASKYVAPLVRKFECWLMELSSPKYWKDGREIACGVKWATGTVYCIQEHMQENVIFDKYGVWWVKEHRQLPPTHSCCIDLLDNSNNSAPCCAGKIFRQSCHVEAQFPSMAVFTCCNMAISHTLFYVLPRFVFTSCVAIIKQIVNIYWGVQATVSYFPIHGK